MQHSVNIYIFIFILERHFKHVVKVADCKIKKNAYLLFRAMYCVDHKNHQLGDFVHLKTWQFVFSKETRKHNRNTLLIDQLETHL